MESFGDSLLLIELMKKKRAHRNISLRPLYDDLVDMEAFLNDISLHHIFRERNSLAHIHILSKEGLLVGRSL